MSEQDDGQAVTAAGEGRSALPARWTTESKAAFLDHLAATCNVRAAAAHVGVFPATVYLLRRRDKRFAAQWAKAIESGYEMLELQLIGHALGGGGPVITNGAVEITGPIDVTLAMSLLANRRARLDGKPHAGGHSLKRATLEETDAAILRRLAALKRGATRKRAVAKAGAR